MKRSRFAVLVALTLVLLVTPVLSACGATPTPTAVPTQPSTAAPTQAPATQAPPTQVPATKAPSTATKVPATATAVPPTPTKGPAVGGRLIWALYGDPRTLDVQLSQFVIDYTVEQFLGSSPVYRDATNKYVPYLAQSWTISSDGLVWEFKLKSGVKFHDGSPFTAKDYAWTFARVKDPLTKAGGMATELQSLKSAEAVDDLTLRLTLKQPFFPFLNNLSNPVYYQPLSKAAIEKAGVQYGRSPVGVGPFKFVQWQTGQKVVLERNADFSWGPAFAHVGPPYIQSIEFRIIPEVATVVAGMEVGELGYADEFSGLAPKDAPRIKASGNFQTFEGLRQGARPYMEFNVSKPPFDDVRVRKAFNLALDRKVFIQALAGGEAVEQKGPLSASTIGYWPGIEQIGYGYDLPQAKKLMQEAGYTYGPDGMLQKDGKPFKLTIKSYAIEMWSRGSEIAQQQYKALGVEMDIQNIDAGIIVPQLQKGDYSLVLNASTFSEADGMYLRFHSSCIGGTNFSRASDPELDKILDLTRTTVDPGQRQEYVNQAQKMIVEQAYMGPLYTPKTYYFLSNRVKGATFSAQSNLLYLFDAYIEAK